MPSLEHEQLRVVGRVRVSLNHLYFESETDEKLDHANVDRLCQIFAGDKCRHSEPWTAIQAVIEQSPWDLAVQAAQMTQDEVRPDDNKLPPRLYFSEDFQVKCVTGRHRVAAARKFLPNKDAWWIVNFLVVDASAALRSHWVPQAYQNEDKLCQGLVFRRILLARRTVDVEQEKMLTSWLSPHCRRCLKQVLRHRPIAAGFERLVDIPGLWRKMQLSTMHKVLSMRLDEEVEHYLEHIRRTFDFIVDGHQETLRLMDSETIEAIEMKCPGFSEADKGILRPKLESGEILGKLSLPNRYDIWQRLCALDVLVPTLFSMGQDARYLEAVSMVLRRIVSFSRREPSISKALEHSFRGRNDGTFKIESQTGFTEKRILPDQRYDLGRRQLWLYAMRNYAWSVQKSNGRPKRAVHLCSGDTAASIGRLAISLGFESPEIIELSKLEPTFHEAARRETEPRFSSWDPGVTGPRCGMPLIDHFLMDRKFLYFHEVHTIKATPAYALTSLFVRLSVYRSFFGNLDMERIYMAPSVTIICASEEPIEIEIPDSAPSLMDRRSSAERFQESRRQLTRVTPQIDSDDYRKRSSPTPHITIHFHALHQELRQREPKIEVNPADLDAAGKVTQFLIRLAREFRVTPYLKTKAPILPDQCLEMAMKYGHHFLLLPTNRVNMSDPEVEDLIKFIELREESDIRRNR